VKIDVFTHFLPKPFIERIEKLAGNVEIAKRDAHIPTLWDLDARLRLLDPWDDLQQILSLAQPAPEELADPNGSPELARIGNDALAEIVARHRDRFPGFLAALPMNNPEAAVREMDRAWDELKAAGVQIYSNVNGRPLDEEAFFPIFARAAERRIPIFLHPTRPATFPDYRTETKSRYELWWAFGWPYETSVAMARLVFSRIMERLPGLIVVTHHMGGMIPYFEGRISPGLDVLGQRTIGEQYEPLARPALQYFKEFYADTALFGAAAATRLGYEFFGAEHCLFASDCPFDPEGGARYIRETIRVLDQLPISEQERRQVYEENARRLLPLG
jgi:predicted TIM-barrel fold metal-dependent hydrolase